MPTNTEWMNALKRLREGVVSDAEADEEKGSLSVDEVISVSQHLATELAHTFSVSEQEKVQLFGQLTEVLVEKLEPYQLALSEHQVQLLLLNQVDAKGPAIAGLEQCVALRLALNEWPQISERLSAADLKTGIDALQQYIGHIHALAQPLNAEGRPEAVKDLFTNTENQYLIVFSEVASECQQRLKDHQIHAADETVQFLLTEHILSSGSDVSDSHEPCEDIPEATKAELEKLHQQIDEASETASDTSKPKL